MINHARTLLLNRPSESSPGNNFPGEHVIPIDYPRLDLPTYLDRIRERLFGSDPDRAMLNYRLQQFMTLLHASQYEGYVTALDNRITYLDTGRRDLFDEGLFVPSANPIGTTSGPIYLQGKPESPDAVGRLYNQHAVEVMTPTSIRVSTFAPGTRQTTTTVTFANSLSSPVALGGSGYSVLVGNDTPGSKWTFDFYQRPTWSLGEITLTLRSIGEPTLLQLFGVTNDEPYNTFKSLWNKNMETPDSLVGLLLAVIYRTDEERISG